jgi:hypothetical protein
MLGSASKALGLAYGNSMSCSELDGIVKPDMRVAAVTAASLFGIRTVT